MSAGAQKKRKQRGDTERSSHKAAAHMGRERRRMEGGLATG